MSATLLQTQSECCRKECDDLETTQIPGPAGAAGSDGTNGTDGLNAFSTVTTGFTMPATGGTTAVFADTRWMSVGQIVFVEFAGYMQADSIPSDGVVNLKNLSDGSSTYMDNAAAGTPIPQNARISASGMQGPNGALTGAAGGQLKGTYPNPLLAVGTTKGDLIVDSGASGGTAARLAVGADGTRLMGDSASPLGVKWAKVDLASTAETTGTLPLTQGGTGATTAGTARTALGLGTMAVQNANAVAVTGGTVVGITDIAVADGGTGASTAAAARANLGVLAGYGILGSVTALNLNSANTDSVVTMLSTRYRIDKIILESPSAAVTTATVGLFTAAAAGGTTLCADQAVSGTLTATTKFMDLAKQTIVDTDARTEGTLYARVGTAEGAARTVNLLIMGWSFV